MTSDLSNGRNGMGTNTIQAATARENGAGAPTAPPLSAPVAQSPTDGAKGTTPIRQQQGLEAGSAVEVEQRDWQSGIWARLLLQHAEGYWASDPSSRQSLISERHPPPPWTAFITLPSMFQYTFPSEGSPKRSPDSAQGMTRKVPRRSPTEEEEMTEFDNYMRIV